MGAPGESGFGTFWRGGCVGPRSLFECAGIEINLGPLGTLAPICGSLIDDDYNRYYNVKIIFF